MYSAIPKFKRVELYLRNASSGYNKVIDEIDKALSSKRTGKEEKLLRDIREKCIELQILSANVIQQLYRGVDSE